MLTRSNDWPAQGGSKTAAGDYVGWTHAVAEDMVHFRHLKPALISTASSSWDDKMGPCDGTVSFPDLGHGPFNGSTPLIVYGPDCNQASAGGRLHAGSGSGSGDVPRMEPATPADPADPLLRDWVKTAGGPIAFEGTPCSFPGRVWKSKVGPYLLKTTLNYTRVATSGPDIRWLRMVLVRVL